jgi:hypothetical protein
VPQNIQPNEVPPKLNLVDYQKFQIFQTLSSGAVEEENKANG